MLRMNQVDQIKELQRQGVGPQEIGSRLQLNRKTVARYMARDDYDREIRAKTPAVSRLDPFKAKIEEWLEEDRRMRFKQRHTAKRVHERLGEEFPGLYDCSYPLVQRYLKARKAAKGDAKGALELVWAAGEAQADFGEADVLSEGSLVTIKYLVLSFPASNAAYLQAFRGETAECVAQGLKDIFHHLGGVPLRIVFDNASGVGRRVGEKVSLSELFLRFKCHYGFSVSFCNPASGNEKGNVENKVGYVRRNFLVPMPVIGELSAWNGELLTRCEEDFERPHYKKPGTIGELLMTDRKALAPLPVKPFNAERFEKVHADGYGKFCLDGRHWYATAPDLAGRELVAGIAAHSITVYDSAGSIQCVHKRIYGTERSDSSNYRSSIEALLRKPGAWRNSQVRAAMAAPDRDYLDAVPKEERMRILNALAQATETIEFETVLESLSEAIRLGTLDDYSLKALAFRAAYESLGTGTSPGPDLAAYDQALLATRGDHP
ncbi:MAG TPA: IS21 family transposase [Rectinemataceae bacterium]|nr:IS21 family transposase [Rectinemataceae bacterium]